jgi:hypothetical protein
MEMLRQQPLSFVGTASGRWFNGCVSEQEALHETGEIRVNEAYRNYVPPVNATAVVHRLLSSVPGRYLRGLSCVVLTNESALSRRDRKGKVWSRKRKFDKSRILGRYHGATKRGNSSPWIELRVDKIIEGLRGAPRWLPIAREIVFGHVLFHELGHHIHRTIRPEHTEKEDVADNWAGKLNANFIRKKYWYAMPMLVPMAKVYGYMRHRHWL